MRGELWVFVVAAQRAFEYQSIAQMTTDALLLSLSD